MNSKLSAKNNYNSIDLFKFFMAIFVIAIHTEPFAGVSNGFILKIFNSTVSLAVPFFFLASGYLLAKKLNWPFNSSDDITAIKKYLFKMIKLYAFWSLIYLPLAVYRYVTGKYSLLSSVLSYIKGFFILGENYNSWILWYLLSTIFALVFILICAKLRFSPYLTVAIGLCLISVGIGFDYLVSYSSTLPTILSSLKNLIIVTLGSGRIFKGAFYISCGMLLAHKKINQLVGLPAFLISYVLNYFISNSFVSAYITIISCVSLFITAENIKLKDSPVYPILRKMSTSMYFIHLYVFTFYYYLVYRQKVFGLDSFLVTTFISIAVSFVYVYIKNKKKSKA